MITRRKKISQEIIKALKKNSSDSEESDVNEEHDEDAIIEEDSGTDGDETENSSGKTKADKVTSNVSFCKMISTMEPVGQPILKSEGGFHYLYEAESAEKIDDWRADGWHWRQQGTSTFLCEGVSCKKFFFYTYLGKAEGEQVLSSGFKREAFMHPDYPLRVLVRYMGDSSVQVATVNTKTVKRRSRRPTTNNQANNADPSSSASNEEYCRMIGTSDAVNAPLIKSPGGSHYVFEADTPDKLDDWRDDGWHWRQQGTSSVQCDGIVCKKFFFYTYLGKVDGEQVLSSAFKREAFLHPNYPTRCLVRYIGDASVQLDTINTKSIKKRSRRPKSMNRFQMASTDPTISNDGYCRMISSLEPVNAPIMNSSGGSFYLFEADNPSKIDDWRDDGWHWRQQGTSSIQCDGVTCKKMFFYTVLGTTEKEQVLSAEFKREAFHHPDYPLRVLVRYIGDSSVQVGLPRDFAKIKRNRARRAVGPDGLRTSAIYRRNEKSAISNEEFCRMIPTMESVSVPITKAMGGFYYMYEADCPSKIEDWRADGWHWRQQGISVIQCDGVTCRKMFFYTYLGKVDGQQVLSSAFKREAYHHPDYPLRILVRYIGDSSVQVPLPHGNSKRREKLASDFVMTRKSKRDEMKGRQGGAADIYKELIGEAPEDTNLAVVTAPRDREQVRNFQKAVRRKSSMNRQGSNLDYSSNEQQVEEVKFVKNIVSYPDFIIVMYRAELWDKIKEQLGRENSPHFCLSYETMFELGDMYVSALIVRLDEFVETPSVPLLIMVHERKLKANHRYFWKKVTDYFPELVASKTAYLVTDDEESIVNAIREMMPNTDIFRSWDNIIAEAKQKLKSLGITDRDDIAQCTNDIRHLLKQDSQLSYYRELSELSLREDEYRWDPEFTRYYKKVIHHEVANLTCQWTMHQHNITNATTNVSEPFNIVLQRLQSWEKRSVGIVILSFEKLLLFLDVEIMKGRYGLGSWTIRPEFADQYVGDAPDFPATVAPHDIVDGIYTTRETLLIAKMVATLSQNDATEDEEESAELSQLSAYEKSLHLITTDDVKLDTDTRQFLMKGFAGKKGKRLINQRGVAKRQRRENDPDHDYHEVNDAGTSSDERATQSFGECIDETVATTLMEVEEANGEHVEGEEMTEVIEYHPAGIEGQVEVCSEMQENSAPMEDEAQTTCIYFEESELIVIFSEESDLIGQPGIQVTEVADEMEGAEMTECHEVAEEMEGQAEDNSITILPSSPPTMYEAETEQEADHQLSESVPLTEEASDPISDETSVSQSEDHNEDAAINVDIIVPPVLPKKNETLAVIETSKSTNKVIVENIAQAVQSPPKATTSSTPTTPAHNHQTRFRRRKGAEAETEESEVITNTSFLTSGQINAVQTILKNQFPDIGGFSCTTLGASLDYPAADAPKWMQILHDGDKHWLLVAKGFFGQNRVVVYDSMKFIPDRRRHVIACISSLLRTKEKEFTYIVKPCQQQKNTYDCGVFAVAYATSIAFGQDPSTTILNVNQMRNHLKRCLEAGKFSLFPTGSRGTRSTKEDVFKEKVYCHCRRSQFHLGTPDWDMMKCSKCLESFHRMCEEIPISIQEKDFKCKSCKKVK